MCVSLTDDPSCSTHMPLHALVTRRPWDSDPATALARHRVARSGQRPPGGTLTLLAAAAWHPWVATVTSGTSGQEGKRSVGGGRAREVKLSVVVACNQTENPQNLLLKSPNFKLYSLCDGPRASVRAGVCVCVVFCIHVGRAGGYKDKWKQMDTLLHLDYHIKPLISALRMLPLQFRFSVNFISFSLIYVEFFLPFYYLIIILLSSYSLLSVISMHDCIATLSHCNLYISFIIWPVLKCNDSWAHVCWITVWRGLIPLTVFALISLRTGGAAVVIKSLRYTGRTETRHQRRFDRNYFSQVIKHMILYTTKKEEI